MLTATLCLLQDQIEAADDAIESLESDIPELDSTHPAIAAVRVVQRQYHNLIVAQRRAITELRKLTPEQIDDYRTRKAAERAKPHTLDDHVKIKSA